MKRIPLPKVFVAIFTALAFATHALAQGSLTPPGAPAPTMKTLAQIEPRTPIASIPITISNSGSYYLTSSLTSTSTLNGITVATNNVLIDLSGFELIGAAGTGSGIVESGLRTNLVVVNGTVRNWPSNGIGGGNCFQARCERLQILDNKGAGLNLADGAAVSDCTVQRSPAAGVTAPAVSVGAGSILRNCVVANSGHIGVRAGGGSSIVDCAVRAGAGHGIEAGAGSVVRGCTALANGGAGFNLLDDATLEHCAARSNSINGFNAGNNSSLSHCVAATNTGSGFVLGHGTTLLGCAARANTRDGILGGTGNVVSQCAVSANRTNGVNLDFGSRINGCTVTSNTFDGIRVSGRCIVSGNNCDGNGTGLHVTFSENRVEENNFTGNGRGMVVDDGYNLIVKNKSTFNGATNTFAVDNRIGPITGNAATNSPWANFDF